jgi:hypothetical protein
MDFFRRGTVARIASGPQRDPDRKHPCVFITGPFEDEGNSGALSVAIVPISSTKGNRPGDPTCILRSGAHEYIVKDSWANYKKAQIKTYESVLNDIKIGKICLSSIPIQGEDLQRLFDGVSKSPDTPERIVIFYQFASLRCNS